MFHQEIILPKKINVIEEDRERGVYEIEGLYPGYGHTLGNSLRRIILSSLPGVSITSVKIKGADHEFATLNGVKEDVLTILLNLKKVRFLIRSGEEAKIRLKVKGKGKVYAKDFETTGEVEVTTPDQYIGEISSDKGELDIELDLAKGIGYVPKEQFKKEKQAIGTILVDAIFSPIRKVRYEVENMRVGERTDYNRLRIHLETDGSISAKDALEYALNIMLKQIRAILDLKEEENQKEEDIPSVDEGNDNTESREEYPEESYDDGELVELLKTRIDTLDFSSRTERALSSANIRTLGGLIQKTADELLAIDNFGKKSLDEVVETLSTFKLSLKNNK